MHILVSMRFEQPGAFSWHPNPQNAKRVFPQKSLALIWNVWRWWCWVLFLPAPYTRVMALCCISSSAFVKLLLCQVIFFMWKGSKEQFSDPYKVCIKLAHFLL